MFGGNAKLSFMMWVAVVVLSDIFQILGFSPFSPSNSARATEEGEREPREGNILAYRALLGKPTTKTHPDAAAAAVAKVKEGRKEGRGGDIIYDICPRFGFGVRLRLSSRIRRHVG